MDLNLRRSCSHMGPSWGQVAPSWSQVGPKLEPIGPSRAEVGALLAEDDPKSGQCCGHVGSKWCLLTILCRSADLQNVQITTARALFGDGARANMDPAQLKLYQRLTDRSIRITRCKATTPRHLRCGRVSIALLLTLCRSKSR